MNTRPHIYIDADACPVKEEVYQVAARYGLRVFLVANSPMRVPADSGVVMIVVGQGADVADDWIAERVCAGDVTVTADIPLAARCLEAGARVLGPSGQPFSEDSIGSALAGRALNDQLRQMGTLKGGPRPLSDKDRSRFSSKLDEMVQAGLREHG